MCEPGKRIKSPFDGAVPASACRHTSSVVTNLLDTGRGDRLIGPTSYSALDTHGNVPHVAWLNFREAGFSHEQALDVLLGICTYTLTTFANRLTETSE